VSHSLLHTALGKDGTNGVFRLWCRLRATTAAPGYFSCYKKPETGQRFLDGALYHNNPVYVAWAESKLLWPDVRHREADIILSIGTGHNGKKTGRVTKRSSLARFGSVSSRPAERFGSYAPHEAHAPQFPDQASSHASEVSQNLKVMFTMMANVLSAHTTWMGFTGERRLQAPPQKVPDIERRFQRLDPDLGFEPPALDRKEMIPELRGAVKRNWQKDGRYREKIRHISRQLVASSFYFETDRQHSAGSGRYECHGK
jgi:hypothetical protein